jgi:hypothetical protein
LLKGASQDIGDCFLKMEAAECVEGCASLRLLRNKVALRTQTTTLRLPATRRFTLPDRLKALDAMFDSVADEHAGRRY